MKEGGGIKVNLNNQAWYDFNTCIFKLTEILILDKKNDGLLNMKIHIKPKPI